MYGINLSPAVREGDSIQTEWSKISYERWCADRHASFRTVPGTKIVNLYEVVNSVIEQDLTETERTAVRLHFFDGLNKRETAQKMHTSYSNAHAALGRAEKKLRLVLKHLIDCEEYKTEIDEF